MRSPSCIFPPLQPIQRQLLPDHIFAPIRHSFSPRVLVTLNKRRWPNLERIFCYDFVPVAQCDHFLVVNHDEVCSIVSRAVEWLPTKEITKYQLTSCFINRHIKYMLANSTVTALVYDFKQRLSEIAKENTLRGFTED